MPTLRVAIVQAEIAPDLDSGLEKTSAWARRAAGEGAQVIVFPETWLPGYPAWLDVCRDVALWDHEPVKRVFARYAAENVVVDGPSGQALSAIAKDCAATLVIGVSERVDSGPGRGTLYNTLLKLEPHPSKIQSPEQWVLRGGSAIYAPDGKCLAGSIFDEEALLVADLDLGKIREESMTLDVAGHYARPDCLELGIRRERKS